MSEQRRKIGEAGDGHVRRVRQVLRRPAAAVDPGDLEAEGAGAGRIPAVRRHETHMRRIDLQLLRCEKVDARMRLVGGALLDSEFGRSVLRERRCRLWWFWVGV